MKSHFDDFIHYFWHLMLNFNPYLNSVNRLIAPSLLSANFNCLEKEIQMLNHSEADWIHLDVMDGVFVPNISFGIPVISHVKKITEKPLDVHLMIIDPDRYISMFRDAGADILTVHFEVCNHLHRTITAIRDHGMKASVCLNPHTPVHFLEEIITYVDLVLLMSVNPGFGGQKFIETTYGKVAQLKNLIESKGSGALIEVDGGVNFDTGKKLFEVGADILVAGSFVFGSKDPQSTIRELKNI
jgi:ribulose-phosphate 3-epimerase